MYNRPVLAGNIYQKVCDFLRVAFYTLGCKVNQYETISMTEQFVKDGFELTDAEDEADVYVLNSCTVTSSSDKKTRQLLRRFRKQNPTAIIAVCGCFPQAFPELADEIPEADVILGASNKKHLLQAVKERMIGSEKIIDIQEYSKDDGFEAINVESFGQKTRAFVKIQDGCERFCAYCIIPFARGPVRSKKLEDLKQELEELAKNGYKEIVLVGINLSCYGTDLGKHLFDAIETACGVKGIERVRLGSLEPELLGEQEIVKMSRLEKLCPQFHLSLQSGSDATLARMRRHYDTAEYKRIVENLREAFPNCAITTDIMVGFPGETEQEFEESLEFAKKIQLARAHVFAFSRREGTSADTMDDQLPQSVKEQRSKRMIEVTDDTRKAFLTAQVGRVEPVLFEVKTKAYWEGYTPNYTTVIVYSDEKNLERKIFQVEITRADDKNCYGRLV